MIELNCPCSFSCHSGQHQECSKTLWEVGTTRGNSASISCGPYDYTSLITIINLLFCALFFNNDMTHPHARGGRTGLTFGELWSLMLFLVILKSVYWELQKLIVQKQLVIRVRQRSTLPHAQTLINAPLGLRNALCACAPWGRGIMVRWRLSFGHCMLARATYESYRMEIDTSNKVDTVLSVPRSSSDSR